MPASVMSAWLAARSRKAAPNAAKSESTVRRQKLKKKTLATIKPAVVAPDRNGMILLIGPVPTRNRKARCLRRRDCRDSAAGSDQQWEKRECPRRQASY